MEELGFLQPFSAKKKKNVTLVQGYFSTGCVENLPMTYQPQKGPYLKVPELWSATSF